MKKNMVLLMVVLLGLCWYVTVGTWMERGTNYRAAMENAKSFEKRELYLDAIAQYEEAMNYTDSREEIMMNIAHDYRKMGDDRSYLSQLENVVNHCGPTEDALKEIYDYYMENSRESKAVEYIAQLQKQYPDNSAVKTYYKLAQKSCFELYNTFQGLGDFCGNYAVYEYEQKYGIVDAAGEIFLKAAYDEIEIPKNLSDGFPVREGGETYLISEKGYKIAQPEENYEKLGALSGQRMLAKKNGKYGYLDQNMKEKTEFLWDDATNYMEGIAAVKNGEKWALINKKGELLTDYIYEDVKRDSSNYCSRNGLIWIKQQGMYILINEKLEVMGENKFEDVKAFISEEPCAVCQNGKWGFSDQSGKLVLECSFEDADSFQIGYAPAKDNGLWGYIGSDGEVRIEYAYDEAKPFNLKGTAPVRTEDVWKLLQLGLYE